MWTPKVHTDCLFKYEAQHNLPVYFNWLRLVLGIHFLQYSDQMNKLTITDMVNNSNGDLNKVPNLDFFCAPVHTVI